MRWWFLFLFPFFSPPVPKRSRRRRVTRRRDRLEVLQSEQERWMSVNCGILSCCRGRGEAASEEDMKEAPPLVSKLVKQRAGVNMLCSGNTAQPSPPPHPSPTSFSDDLITATTSTHLPKYKQPNTKTPTLSLSFHSFAFFS